jgi:hypothetical protein
VNLEALLEGLPDSKSHERLTVDYQALRLLAHGYFRSGWFRGAPMLVSESGIRS